MRKVVIQAVLIFTLLFFTKVIFGQVPDLGAVHDFVLFSSNGAVTNTGGTAVTGDVGGNKAVASGYNLYGVAGTVHANPDNSTEAGSIDLLNVYNYLNGRPAEITLQHPEQFGHNLILTPHIYLSVTATVLTDTLYLDAGSDPNAIFVIKINGALGVSTNAKVILINGTNPGNVFWVVDGSVNLGSYSDFKGTIVCNGSININTGATLSGRALTTDGALQTSSITATLQAGNQTPHSTYTWRGGKGDWNDAANWNTQSSIPVPLSKRADVIIPSGSPSVTTAVTIGNMQISSASNLSIEGSVYVAGNITGSNESSTVIGGTGKVVLAGDSLQILRANTTFSNLELNNNNGASIDPGGTVSITGVYTPTAGTLVTNDKFVLRSSEKGTAMIASAKGNYISGHVTIEKYIAAKRAWWLLTAPVAGNTAQTIHDAWQEAALTSTDDPLPGYGTHITGGSVMNGFDQSPTNSASIKYYDNGWVNLNNTAATTMTQYQGYFVFVRGSRAYNISSTTSATPPSTTTLRVKGALNQGPKTFTFNNPTAGEFILVGNPYAAPVDFATIGKSNIENTFYAWDALRKGASSGGYVTVSWDAVSGTYDIDYSPGQTKQTQIIQSGQAVLLQVRNEGEAATVTFNETDKTASANRSRAARESSVDLSEQLRITLSNHTDTSNIAVDGVLAKFGTGYSIGTGDDAEKLTNSEVNLSFKRGGLKLSIERRPLISESDTLYLNTNVFKAQGQYTFEFEGSNFENLPLDAFLVDKYLRIETPINLTTDSIISFKVGGDAASADSTRFMVIFKTRLTLPVTVSSIQARQNLQDVQIEWSVENEAGVQQYVLEKSLDGVAYSAISSIAATNNNSTETYTQTDVSPDQGSNFYRIKIVQTTGAFSYSSTLKVQVLKGRSGFSVYPNPITNRSASVQLVNLAAATYRLRLYDVSGHLLVDKSIQHPGNASTQTVLLPSSTASGTYYFTLTGANNSVNFKQNVVVQ